MTLHMSHKMFSMLFWIRTWIKSFVVPCRLTWHDTDPEIARQLSRRVKMKLIADRLTEPESLLFHTLLLTDDWCGPSVFVWGQRGSDAFHCEYCEITAWT